MQDRKTRLPAGDPVLRADLHSIKSQVGITGTRRLVADGESDGHADRFWAAALACSAAEMGEQLIAYQGVPGTRSRFALPDHDDEDEETEGRWGNEGGAW
ncbi:hypothetical protein [Rhodobacter capsulatus]|uniref:hypothetical protein n=1 Tax=Rhodobacter capsulatus TaxID=1061 RepID=UPI0040251421